MEASYSSSYDSPNAVEHIPVWEHSDIQVGGEDRVEPPDLLVTEEGVRHPHLARVRHRQVFYLTLFRIGIRQFYFSKIVKSFVFFISL